ncbi:MAG: class I SAM-dependent methyltransferase [Candidatus Methanomethylicus sp.]|nr:class I SAM-dependent methyltransferase [Candidatus Methanomethylicus sp.]
MSVGCALTETEGKITDYSEKSWFNLHSRRFKETLNALLENVPTQTELLELGSFPGHMTLALKQLGFNVIGVDIAPERFINILKGANIPVNKVDLERDQLPFVSSTFGCVLFTEVLEHLSPERAPLLLKEICRVLGPKGYLLISTPNVKTLDNRLLKFFRKQVMMPEHKKEYAMVEIEQMLESSGFRVVKKWFSLNRDVVTHGIPDEFISKDHVFVGASKNPYWKNVGRAVTLPIKFLWPSLRSTLFIFAEKAA